MSRGVTLAVMLAGVAAVGAAAVAPIEPRLVWNASASAPIGLYAIDTRATPRRGDLVVVAPPPCVDRFIRARGYLPPGVPLVKRVAALSGQHVCRDGPLVTVDGAPVAAARTRDSRGRPLPAWRGCRTLGLGEVFLLNLAPDSLDGRYFGALPANAVRGRAIPVLTDAAGDGRFRWRADDRALARFFSHGDPS